MVSTTTAVSSVPVREEVLALAAGTICAFVLLQTLATRSYDGMFRAEDDLVVISQIFARSRGIITTLSTCAFSLILPFASLGSRGIVLLAGLVAISS